MLAGIAAFAVACAAASTPGERGGSGVSARPVVGSTHLVETVCRTFGAVIERCPDQLSDEDPSEESCVAWWSGFLADLPPEERETCQRGVADFADCMSAVPCAALTDRESTGCVDWRDTCFGVPSYPSGWPTGMALGCIARCEFDMLCDADSPEEQREFQDEQQCQTLCVGTMLAVLTEVERAQGAGQAEACFEVLSEYFQCVGAEVDRVLALRDQERFACYDPCGSGDLPGRIFDACGDYFWPQG